VKNNFQICKVSEKYTSCIEELNRFFEAVLKVVRDSYDIRGNLEKIENSKGPTNSNYNAILELIPIVSEKIKNNREKIMKRLDELENNLK